jgi:hypothetical protein
MTGTCPKGDECPYIHAPEIAYQEDVQQTSASNVPVYSAVSQDNNQCTALCLTWLKKYYGMISETCRHGSRCSFAHAFGGVKLYGFIKDFEDDLLITNKIPLQKIFEEVAKVITENFKQGNEYLTMLNKQTVQLPVMIPSNFQQILDTWKLFARSARKCKEQFVIDDIRPMGLFSGPDSTEENQVWALSRFTGICNQDVTCEYKKLVGEITGKSSHIKGEDICSHGGNCRKDTHISGSNGVVRAFCMDELCGRCKCDSLETVMEKRQNLRVKLEQLKAERIKRKADGVPIGSLETTIESTAWQFVNTFRKRHFSEFGYSMLTKITETTKPEETFTLESFDHELESMTDDERAKYNARIKKEHDLFLEKTRLAKLAAEEKAAKEKAAADLVLQELLKTIDISSPLECRFIASKAYLYMSLTDFIKDCVSSSEANDIFGKWSMYFTTFCSFHQFRKDVENKLEIWINLGIERRCTQKADTDGHEDQFEEIWVPSEKEEFKDFWAWYENIPITKDKSIVGNLSHLIEAAPELFQQYRTECPTFDTTFPEWIEQNPTVTEIVKLFHDSREDFFVVSRYVQMGVQSTKMTIREFAKHKHTDVSFWMQINTERKHLKSSPLSLEECIANATLYKDFYLKGWHVHYEIEEFIKQKNDHWQFKESGVRTLASENSGFAAKIKAKMDKQAKAAEMYLMSSRLINSDGSLNFEAFGLGKAQPVVKKPTKSMISVVSDDESDSSDDESVSSTSSDAESVSSTSSDAESVSSTSSDAESKSFNDFDFDFDDGCAELLTKPKKVLPLNAMTSIGNFHKFHVYREETKEDRQKGEVIVRTNYFGPFASEVNATNVLNALSHFNKTSGGGRTMHLKVEKTCGVPDVSADCWNVVYGDTKNPKYEKPESYDWIVTFINKECTKSGVFEGLSLNELFTNISNLQGSIAAFLEKADKPKPKDEVQPVKRSVVQPMESTKPVRLSAAQIKASLEKKNEQKKLAKQALKDAKIVKKEVISVATTLVQPTVVPKQTNCKKLAVVKVERDNTLLDAW